MNKKGFVNIALIVFLAIIAGVTGYLVMSKKSPEVVKQITTPTTTTLVQTVNTLASTTTATSTLTLKKSGIKGEVIVRYCNGAAPSEPWPDYQPCGEDPLPSFLLNIKNDLSGVEQQITTNSTGKFQVELSPGQYTITGPISQSLLGGPFSLEVKPEIFTEAQLKFEGLRP